MNITPDSLFQRLTEQTGEARPPVHLWEPEIIKDIGLRITRDGTWWYQGTPIERHRMVRLFSRVLRRDGPDYFLVTPVEKVKIDVEVAPLLAVRMEVRSDACEPEIAFQTNVGDIVVADRDHPIKVRGTRHAPLPMVLVRDGIEALIARNVYYELVERGELRNKNGAQAVVVRSRGAAFELGEVTER